MNDSTRRAIRTGIDAAVVVLLALVALLAYPGLPEVLDNALGKEGATAAIGVVAGAALLFVTKIKNALEDSGRIPAILKEPATVVPDDPIPAERIDERGRVEGDDRALSLDDVHATGDTSDYNLDGTKVIE